MENNQVNSPLPNDEQPTIPSFQQDPDDQQTQEPELVYVTWTGQEFIEHTKPASWFLIVVASLFVICLITFVIVRSIFPVIMIILIGIVFIVVALRKPKEIEYELTNRGIFIGKRLHHYDDFKSFSVVDEGEIASIVFNPLKRFAFPPTIYYELENEEKIVRALVEHLPVVEPLQDPIENLMRKIRF
jgi:hypothetical protein